MSPGLVIFLKELRENLRDRRTLASALLFGPLLGPVMLVMLLNVILTRELDRAEKPLEVPVIGAEHAPNLMSALHQMGLEAKDPVADPIRAVLDRDADVVLRIPAGYGEAWRKGEMAQVELFHDSSQQDTQSTVARLKKMLQQYSRQQGAMRLVARGLSPTLANPLAVDARDQSTPQSRAGMLFAMLPYFFILSILIGGMYLAIDLTAGERERQSLEPLFANPLPRWRILVAKLAAISAFSFASLVICVIAFGVAGRFMPMDRIGMTLDFGPRFASLTLLLMLPLVLILATLQTLVAAFAKSFREAQTYLSFVMLLPAIPAIALSIAPVKTEAWMYAVPLLAQQVGVTELLRGNTMASMDILACLATGLVATLVLVAVTAKVYRSERLAISA